MPHDAQSTLADRTIAALRVNHEDLAGRVRGLDESGLARQSGAADWDVAGVLSHLGSGAEIMLADLRAGVAGAAPPDAEFAPSVWERWNARGPRDRAEGFLRANDELVTALENLDATARQEVLVELGFLPEPADLEVLTGLRLSEAALHGWDIRVATDPLAGVPSEEADITLGLIEGRLSFLLGFLGSGVAPDATDAILRVETADPEHVFGLVLADTAILQEDAPAQADGVLAGPAEAIVRLMYGRLDPVHTPDSVTVTGDAVTLDQLRAVFPGI